MLPNNGWGSGTNGTKVYEFCDVVVVADVVAATAALLLLLLLFVLHGSFALFTLDSVCVELLLFTSCRSALFMGRLSKSVIIAAFNGFSNYEWRNHTQRMQYIDTRNTEKKTNVKGNRAKQKK